MVAGNVSVYGVDVLGQRAGPIRVGKSAVVTNSCVLQAGVELPESTLLGDLSVAGQADVIPPNAIAVGSPPRVVGRTNFRLDAVSTRQYVLMNGRRSTTRSPLIQFEAMKGLEPHMEAPGLAP